MVKVHDKYLLVKTKSKGVDPIVDIILSDEDTADAKKTKALYEKARAIYLSDIRRSYVEACLMATDNLDQIQEVIEVPVDVLQMYREFFFNLPSRDKLTLLELIEDSKTAEERGMKIWAISQGLSFVAWRLGRAVNVNPVEGLQELFTLCVFKSKEALFSGNASESSREATKWTKLSMDLARLLKAWVMDSSAATKDIELALASLSPDFKGFDSLDQDDI